MIRTIAITGGTGFVGRTLLDLALSKGFALRVLTRREQAPRSGVTWIRGALDRPDTLRELATGADAMMHVAGVTSAPDRAGFEAGNATGTLTTVEAAKAEGVRRFVHISSLAAREPDLSDYGWSKARSESIVKASGFDWTIVRPPAVYGPGDRETMEMFRMARRGFVLLPPGGRLSLIAASDLAALMLAVVLDEPSIGRTYEPDDGTPAGWDHRDFARALGEAWGRTARPLPVASVVLRAASRLDVLLRGSRAKLTGDRVGYFLHPDWVVNAESRPPLALWRPRVGTPAGLKETALWYVREGWIR